MARNVSKRRFEGLGGNFSKVSYYVWMDDYLRDSVRQWLGLSAADLSRAPELPGALRRRFLLEEERTSRQRDTWGNWEHSFSSDYWAGKLWTPEVNDWVEETRNRLVAQGVPMGARWPDERPFAVCLTHDVDRLARSQTWAQRGRGLSKLFRAEDLRALPASEKALYGMTLGGGAIKGKCRVSLEESIDLVVGLERENGATSSFFFTHWLPSRLSIYDCVYTPDDEVLSEGSLQTVAALMKKLDARGFDVGLHGAYFSARTPGLLQEQRQALRAATGLSIATTRQHFLAWDSRVTPKLQAEAGFVADTTLGYNRNVGFRAGVALPFRLYDFSANRALDTWELPLTIMDGALFANNSLELDLEAAKKVTALLLDRIEATGGVATLLFHPDAFTNSRVTDLYAWTLARCRGHGAWLTSAREIARWWENRPLPGDRPPAGTRQSSSERALHA